MAQFRKYTKEQFIQAIATSPSLAQALTKLNVAPYGGNYAVAKSYIKQFNINTSHFIGQGWNKGKKHGPKRPIEDYLSNKFKIKSYELRKRLIAEKIFESNCSSCHLNIWLNKPMPLELEHKNGNHNDNSLLNLCLLCPNCHAFTPTYCRRKPVN